MSTGDRLAEFVCFAGDVSKTRVRASGPGARADKALGDIG
jgi:hypothetical protein